MRVRTFMCVCECVVCAPFVTSRRVLLVAYSDADFCNETFDVTLMTQTAAASHCASLQGALPAPDTLGFYNKLRDHVTTHG